MRSTLQMLASMGTAVLLASVVVLVAVIGSARSMASAAERPNILFVMTDDQPKDTMMAMPQVRTQVRDMGMSLSNAYVSESLCCP